MNSQKRDMVIGARRVAEAEGGQMMCDECGVPLEGFASCYCEACEDAMERAEYDGYSHAAGYPD